MQPDELKTTWQQLSQQIERQQGLQRQWLGGRRRDRMRDSLRSLYWGQLLQLALGIALVVLGIACWQCNPDLPGYFAAGVVLHGFGVMTAVLASLTLARTARIDYAAPVLHIEQQLATLRRLYAVNTMLAGWPWWLMWIVVVVAVAGLARLPSSAATSAWIWTNLAAGLLGGLGTGGLYCAARKRRRPHLGQWVEDAVTGYSLRRARALLEELREFERE